MPLRFVTEPSIRDVTELHRRQLVDELQLLLPLADIEHVGSTAIPAAWTTGILDLQLRVDKDEFADAEQALAARFARDERFPKKSKTFAAFVDEPRAARIVLTEKGSAQDVGHRRRDVLLGDPFLRERYNAIKRRHQGGDEAAYQAEKARFWEETRV